MKLWMSWLNLKTYMRLLRPSSESCGLNLSLDSNKLRHSQQFERVNSALPRPLRFVIKLSFSSVTLCSLPSDDAFTCTLKTTIDEGDEFTDQ
jgi:hypothetical protein